MAVKIESRRIEPKQSSRYYEDNYIDAINDKGEKVRVLNPHRPKTLFTEEQVDSQIESLTAQVAVWQKRKDEITSLKGEE